MREVCILVVMRLTKNTNKEVRAWVDNIISQLELVKGDVSYKEHYETLQQCSLLNRLGMKTKEEVVQTMRDSCGCVSPSEVEHAQKLCKNHALDEFLNEL